MTLTLGADPELFLVRGNNFVSSIGKIGGSKAIPRPLTKEGFFVQEDNVALEFNIPPVETITAWVDSLQWALSDIASNVLPEGLSLSVRASADFPEEEIASPEAKMFGCDPDYNAWTGRRNPRPNTWKTPALRSCGGHVHVGWPEAEKNSRRDVVKAMDLFLGIPSVLMDLDVRRRNLYGQAGAHRPTPYGVEYRTLSNFWLQSKEHMEWAFTQTQRAFAFAAKELNIDLLNSEGESIQKCINNTDTDMANEYVATYGLSVV